jgi:acetyltransferase-like isoleucine patch superfamily enzyme
MSSDTPNSPRRQTVLGEYLTDPKVSALRKYQDLVVGDRRWLTLARFELTTGLLGGMPGMAGLGLRRLLYPSMLGGAGRNVVFGPDITLRHPAKIHLGDNVIVDAGVVLDAKGTRDPGIRIGTGSVIGRNCGLSCKGGTITCGDGVNLGPACMVLSETQVVIGDNCIFAALCYLVAGGNHDFSRIDVPIIQQPSLSRGGIRIEPDVWLGARVTVLDGVTIGRGSVVGAGAVVTGNLAPYSIAVGVPARVIRSRKPEDLVTT